MNPMINNFYKKNPMFTIFCIVTIILGIALETLNYFLDIFPDKSGAGYYFSGLMLLILVASYFIDSKKGE